MVSSQGPRLQITQRNKTQLKLTYAHKLVAAVLFGTIPTLALIIAHFQA